jgi:orotate phosphoribosyltransferase-like protein
MAKTGRPSKAKDPATIMSAMALRDNGLNQKEISKILDISPATVARALEDAQVAFVARMPEYADLHLEAARIAASKGKAEASQWALERGGVVKPPESESSKGVRVQIGIALPGLSLPAGAVVGVQEG